MKTYKYLLFSIVVTILLAGCESLDVKNENDPDFKTAFSNPSDVRGVAGSLFNTWYETTVECDDSGLAPMLWVGADAGTCSWGNFGMRDFSYEPRRTWDNTPAYPNAMVSEIFYNDMYGNISAAAEVLAKLVKEGMKIEADDGTDETEMVKAFTYLCQGLSLGYIGLIYDKGFVVTESTDRSQAIPLSPYTEMIDSAVKCIDKCISICSSETFAIPATWVAGMTLTEKELGELANTAAALLLSYSPRSKADNDNVNWATVLGYANKGLTQDFQILCDGYQVTWSNEYHDYANTSGWGMTDMRLVNMMDPRFPSRWTDANTWTILPPATTSHTAGIDDRIFTDFVYQSSCGFRVERGYYHFSCYRFQRFDAFIANGEVGYTPLFYKAENDMLKAEALLHQSDLTAAAAIINAGTRVTRGALAPIGATADEVEGAIFHERFIECFCSGFGLEFFTMRKAGKLQAGTPLHFPIPGQQLEVNIMENYTFGGVGADQKGVPGVDVSNGGWFTK
jgi:hypothetical protein